MSHLRDLVAALVDGQLSHAERERALAHLAGCTTCRAEVAAHRAVKERVAATPPPGVPSALLANLHRMAEPGEPLPPARRIPGDPASRPPTVTISGRPPKRADRTGPRGRRHRLNRVVGVGAVAVTTLLMAFAVGGNPGSGVAPVRPDVNTYVIEHAKASRLQPFADVPGEAVQVFSPRQTP